MLNSIHEYLINRGTGNRSLVNLKEKEEFIIFVMKDNTWTVSGFGINADDIFTSTDVQITFLKKYFPEEYEAMVDDFKRSAIDASDTAAYIDFCNEWISNHEDEDSNETGFPVLLAKAIKENENIDVAYFNGDESGAILYADRQPWLMTSKEKALTKEGLIAIFQKYLDELGIKAEPGMYSVSFSD